MSIEITGPGEVTTRPYVDISELLDDTRVGLWPLNPDQANLEISCLDDDGFDQYGASAVLSVYDAIKLREGLDAFISQAVGADV